MSNPTGRARASFIVRKRRKVIAKANPLRRRGYLKFGKWETVKACDALDEATKLAEATVADDVLISHHGREVYRNRS